MLGFYLHTKVIMCNYRAVCYALLCTKIAQGCHSSGNFNRYSVIVDSKLHLCHTAVLASVGISKFVGICNELTFQDFFSNCFFQ